ncbi:MAG: DUF4271 domain-containing protein [Bacteroidota bacterium]
MSGQDPTMMPFTDTLNAVKEPVLPSIFDLSGIAEGIVPVEAGLEMVPKDQIIHPAWLFIYLFVLLGFFAWIRLYYGNLLTQTVQATTNFQVANRMFKDNSLLQRQLDNILLALYFLSVTFLLFFMEERLKVTPLRLHGSLLYLFNLALLVGVFFGKIVLINLAGFLFNRIRIFREYLYNAFIFNKLMGMVILPMLLFVVYTSGVLQGVFFWLTLATIALVVVMRLIRGVVFSFKKNISIFYMFLYLCALEIAPLVLLYKWLEGIL